MKFFTLIFAIICVVTSTFAKIETEDSVLVLTKDNFEEAIEQYDYLLVEFYAPWCGHCKSLAPEYAKAAKKLEEDGSPVKLAKVDATVEIELADKHELRGYPTLKFYRKGSIIDYSGHRQAHDIINWVTKKSGPAYKHLTTVDEVKSFIEPKDVAIIGFFKDMKSDGANAYLKVANALDDHVFGISDNDEVFNEYGVENGKIVIFKKFDESRSELNEELDVKKLQNLIFVYTLPLVVDFNPDTAQKIFDGNIKKHLLVFLSKEAGHFEEYIDKIKEPAKKFRGEVVFVKINVDESDHERILEFFGTKKDEVPVMRIITLEQNMTKYKPDKPELTSENIVEFVTAFLEGKLKKHLLTEDLPEDWDKNPVKVLVGTNFHEVAYDKNKNVLVEFYAPWCGHCKNLAPIYEALGEKYKNTEDLVIAKMDATANELEDVKIIDYPTIILFKKETNEAVEYLNRRTLEGLSEFIDSNGTSRVASEEVQEDDEDDDVPRKDEL
ncbi:PREDICTED: protein disulfide-isomerase isoform X1 [Eufriesea mexicana]|uniref:protein disulfide-isomerase isoform X1 n=1 Tax=Eufriesea mexicana TaxID=516756 RepID=UPI00083C50DE|nr:PREDICTED: protein disulfide-isomerase isoform X1 [Eufriesea mexicana]